MWGLGVILYQLLSSELPFYSKYSKTHIQRIVKQEITFDDNKIWNDVSAEAKDLLKKLLDKNPKSRLSAS